MNTFELRGLEAHNPLGFLCALGTLSLLADRYGNDVGLAWTRAAASWVPFVVLPGTESEDALLDELVAACAARDLEGELGWSKDVRLADRDEVRRALESAAPGRSREMVAASVAELPLWRDGPPHTPFRLPGIAPAQLLDSALRQSAKPRRKDLRATLFEPWRYESGVNPLRLDPGARRQARALMAEAPTHAKTNGVPGSVLLGIRGLTFFPLQPTVRGARSACWDEQSFLWPIWDRPLPERLVRLVLVLPWLRERGDDAAANLRAHHVVARYRAARQRLGSDGAVLTWGEPFA